MGHTTALPDGSPVRRCATRSHRFRCFPITEPVNSSSETPTWDHISNPPSFGSRQSVLSIISWRRRGQSALQLPTEFCCNTALLMSYCDIYMRPIQIRAIHELRRHFYAATEGKPEEAICFGTWIWSSHSNGRSKRSVACFRIRDDPSCVVEVALFRFERGRNWLDGGPDWSHEVRSYFAASRPRIRSRATLFWEPPRTQPSGVARP